jgi:hypothetical protein
MLCCALTNLVYKIQIHTKDGSEENEEASDNMRTSTIKQRS